MSGKGADIIVNAEYRCTKTKNVYIVKGVATCKDRDIVVVLYQDSNKRFYTRGVDEFLQKFKRVIDS